MFTHKPDRFIGTTIVGVRHNGKVAIGGDGQVTLGNVVMKHHSTKVRKLYNDTILAGFAGAAADAFTLFEKFEEKLERFSGNLPKVAVELAKEWRTDKYLRRLEALLAVMDKKHTFLISGTGDVIEPDDEVIAIGSGGISGKGFLNGSQTRYKFLPTRHTDFILSVMGEEFGFFGVSLLLFLFFILFYRQLDPNIPLKDEFTFGLNRIYLLFNKMGFRTTYFVSVNKYVI